MLIINYDVVMTYYAGAVTASTEEMCTGSRQEPVVRVPISLRNAQDRALIFDEDITR
jgi:hypothetical protein